MLLVKAKRGGSALRLGLSDAENRAKSEGHVINVDRGNFESDLVLSKF